MDSRTMFQLGKIVEQSGRDKVDPTPANLGWVCVEIGLSSPLKYWMRMVMPYASKQFGWAFYPEIGDQVLVMCLDSGEWLCLGSLYTGTNKAKVFNDEGKKYGKNKVKEIRTATGNAITIGDEKGKEYVTVDVKEGKMRFKMDLGGKSVLIDGGPATKVDVTAKDSVLTVTCKDAIVKAGDALVELKGGKINVKGAKITVTSDGDITVKAGGKVKIDASAVEIC
jgi:uncharacterized protein involved in type VI secretion and phage assembly